MQAGPCRTWGSGEEVLRPVTAEGARALEASAQPCADGTSTSIFSEGPRRASKGLGQEPHPPHLPAPWEGLLHAPLVSGPGPIHGRPEAMLFPSSNPTLLA